MKYLTIIVLVLIIDIRAQKLNNKPQNPCSDRTIIFARKFGVKALPIKDIPRYHKASKECLEKGGEALIDQIIQLKLRTAGVLFGLRFWSAFLVFRYPQGRIDAAEQWSGGIFFEWDKPHARHGYLAM